MKTKSVRPSRRMDDANAFLRDPSEGAPSRARDDLAEELAEEFVGAATSGQEQGEEQLQAMVLEEIGGPFVPTTAKREFARGTDLSNPKDAEPAPFPLTNARVR